MGFVAVLGPCIRCKRPFVYSPTRVPSIRIDGVRHPICATCVEEVNPLRIANGLPPINPLPGAYDADDESEMGVPGWSVEDEEDR